MPLYGQREARAVVRTVLEEAFGLSLTGIVCGKVNELSADDGAKLEKMMARLSSGEPVQYVIGHCAFCGHTFHVAPGVLIPRPETAEMVGMMMEEEGKKENKERKAGGGERKTERARRVLDIGTGSGCIAVTLALAWPHAQVEAWDISDAALAIARGNARSLGAVVRFRHRDALDVAAAASSEGGEGERWSLIVSNPPYVTQSERQGMAPNVLEHEPATALFVPDDDPLRFYRAIARYAARSLQPEGRLWLELNPRFAQDTKALAEGLGFRDVTLIDDAFGRCRFLSARRASSIPSSIPISPVPSRPPHSFPSAPSTPLFTQDKTR